MAKEEIINNAEKLFSEYYKNLEDEKQKQSIIVKYINEIDSKSETAKSYNYYNDIAMANFNMISKLENLPTYARIQAMSDLEIEAYRKEQIAKLEKDIEEIKGKQEQSESSEQINDLKKQQSLMESKTPQEIKDELLDQVKNSFFLRSVIESTKKELNPTTELYATFANNYVSANNIAELLTQHRLLSDKQRQIREPLNLQDIFPELLKKELQKNHHFYDSKSCEVIDPDGLLNIINDFEKRYLQAKEIFINQFTIDKLKGLINKKDEIDNLVVDLQFLELHADKLGKEDLERLQQCFYYLNEYSKKFFKSTNTKRQISDLNFQIHYLGYKMYNSIISWYEIQGKQILGYPYRIDFCSLDDLTRTLQETQESVDKIKDSIIDIRKKVIECQAHMNIQLNKYISKQARIAQRIKISANYNGKFSDTPIWDYDNSYAPSNLTEDNINTIKNTATAIKQREIIINVITQAQLDADIKEAQLRGITIEQLLNEKKQAQDFNHKKN